MSASTKSTTITQISTKFGSEMRRKPQWMYGAGAFIGSLRDVDDVSKASVPGDRSGRKGRMSVESNDVRPPQCDQWPGASRRGSTLRVAEKTGRRPADFRRGCGCAGAGVVP